VEPCVPVRCDAPGPGVPCSDHVLSTVVFILVHDCTCATSQCQRWLLPNYSCRESLPTSEQAISIDIIYVELPHPATFHAARPGAWSLRPLTIVRLISHEESGVLFSVAAVSMTKRNLTSLLIVRSHALSTASGVAATNSMSETMLCAAQKSIIS
jgi:hypothetical protein